MSSPTRYFLPLVAILTALSARADLDRSIMETARHATALIECFDGGRYLGSASAFCIDSGGIFVTNNHVATTGQRNNKISLFINPGTKNERQLLASVVRTDPNNNLAILRVDRAGPLEAIELADTPTMNALKETTPLTVFGFPVPASANGAKPEVSISNCRITALRHEQSNLRLIQTDGAINDGNSGGPAIDDAGQVIAVVAPSRLQGPGIVQINGMIPASRVRELLTLANIHLAPGILSEPAMLLAAEDAQFKIAPNRRPAPTDAQYSEAMKLVRELFEKQYADTTTTGLRNLGPSILAVAKTTNDDAISRYAMLRQAIAAATAVADFKTAISAANELIKFYDVDPLKLKDETISQLAPKITRSEDHALLAAHALILVRADIHHQAYADAQRLIPIVRHAASSSANSVVVQRVRDQLAVIEALCDDYDRLKDSFDKLAKNPADPDANLAIGRFTCLRLSDFAKGLPYLAKCSDPNLKAIAIAELANPASGFEQKDLADLWWDEAQRESKNETSAQTAQRRAAYWYERAKPQVKGLARIVCDQRLAQLPQNSSMIIDPIAIPVERLRPGTDGWTVLFRSSEPIVWNTYSREPNSFAAPLSLAPSNMRYLRIRKNDGDFAIIPLNIKQLDQSLSGNNCGWEGRSLNINNAFHLGIFVQGIGRPNGTVDVTPEYTGKTGYGFGNYVRQDNRQGYAWAGRTIDKTVFEFSVTSNDLTKKEKEKLLKWD